MWVSGLVSAGLGVAGGIMGGKNARKLKARREPWLRQADQMGQQLVSDLTARNWQKQSILDKSHQQAEIKLARQGYSDKAKAITGQRKALGRAQQQGIDTGLINSSVFQGARRGITAETSALLASIGERVSAMRAEMDLQKGELDASLVGERGEIDQLGHDLGMASADRWLQHQTGGGFAAGTAQSGPMDLSGLGDVTKYLLKGAGGKSSSLFDMLSGLGGSKPTGKLNPAFAGTTAMAGGQALMNWLF